MGEGHCNFFCSFLWYQLKWENYLCMIIDDAWHLYMDRSCFSFCLLLGKNYFQMHVQWYIKWKLHEVIKPWLKTAGLEVMLELRLSCYTTTPKLLHYSHFSPWIPKSQINPLGESVCTVAIGSGKRFIHSQGSLDISAPLSTFKGIWW